MKKIQLFLLLGIMTRLSAQVILDPTFSGDGLTINSMTPQDDYIMGMSIQSDGKTVVCGYGGPFASPKMYTARFNTDGSLDNSFDGDGIRVDSLGIENALYDVIIQSDGKILVGGYTYSGNTELKVLRYNADGSLDATFATGGIFTYNYSSGIDIAYSLALQSDGKIIVLGTSYSGLNLDMVVIRLTTNGTLDTSFDSDGVVMINNGSNNDDAKKVLVQPDGKIVIVGQVNYGPTASWSIARLNTDGSLDNTFGVAGSNMISLNGTNDNCRSAVLQPDGKILLVGYTQNTDYDLAIVRFNTNGTLDNSFNSGGVIDDTLSGGQYGYDIELQPDGKIVVSQYNEAANNSMELIRLNTDGSMDNTFNGDGSFDIQFGSGIVAFPICHNVLNDGKIIVAGYAQTGGLYDMAIARVDTAGSTLVSGFNDNIVLVYPNPSADFVFVNSIASIYNVAMYSLDGRLVKNLNYPDLPVDILMNLMDVNAGIYYLSISTTNGNYTEKIILQ